MKAYIIVQGGNIAELEEKVGELAVEGYVPTGGVSQIVSRVVQAVYHPRICDLFKAGPEIRAIDGSATFPVGPVPEPVDACDHSDCGERSKDIVSES